MSLRQISRLLGNAASPPPLPLPNPAPLSPSTWGADRGAEFAGWEADSIFGCVCDAGFFGPDCSMLACPRADDPETTNQQGRSILLRISHPTRDLDANADFVALVFETQRASFPALGSAQQIKEALVKLKNVGGVEVQTDVADVATGGSTLAAGAVVTVHIVITGFRTLENNFHRHDGDPPLSFFFCDTTGSANGLTATTQPQAEDATYDVVVTDDQMGGGFKWRRRPDEAYSDEVRMSPDGNTELASDGTSLRLKFTPAAGRVVGEAWTILVGGAVASVLPATTCAVEDTDLSLAAAGTYGGGSSEEYILEIAASYDADGRNQYLWKTSGAGVDFGSPVTLAAGVAQDLSNGVTVTFASDRGHTPGARYRVTGSAPTATATAGVAAFMTARGTSATAAGFYRVEVTDATTTPNGFRAALSTVTMPPTARNDPTVRTVDVRGNYIRGTDGRSDPSSGNGITLVFSSAGAYFDGMEWAVTAAAGGAVSTVARPTAPLVVETSGSTTASAVYTIIIRSAGNLTSDTPATFDYYANFTGSGRLDLSQAPIPIADWTVGNALTMNGVRLRFFSQYGHAPNMLWVVNISDGGKATVTSAPLSRVRVAVSGSTLSSTYRVRIVSSLTGVGGVDQFEVSEAGAAFTGPYDIVTTADGNSELGNGVLLRFVTTDGKGFAPGQLWEIETFGAGVRVTATPGLREFSMCAGRGICSVDTGYCSCVDGYAGMDCAMQTGVLIEDDNRPTQLLKARNPLYTGDVLRLETDKAPSPDFYFIQAIAKGTRLFGIRGDGQVAVQLFSVDTMTVRNGIIVEDGGIQTYRRGITIHAGGLDVLSGGTRLAQTLDAEALSVYVNPPMPSGFTSTAVRIEVREADVADATDHYLARFFTSLVDTTQDPPVDLPSTERFSIKGTGATAIASGGLTILNPAAYSADGPAAARAADPFFGGASIAGGLTVTDYGILVKNGGLSVFNAPRSSTGAWPANITLGPAQDGLYVKSEDDDYVGTVIHGEYAGAAADDTLWNLLSLDSKGGTVFSIDGTGFTHLRSGGVLVDAGGLSVINGGLEVVNTGARIQNGGLEIVNGGIRVDSGGGVVSVNSQDYGAVSIIQTGSSYTNTLLQLQAEVPPSPNFNFISASANSGDTYFRLDGQGDIYLGNDGSGNARVRIAANGYIQTLSSDDINVEADTGQTVIVSAGAAIPAQGQVGSIFIKGGEGLVQVMGGDISLTGGTATDYGNGGNAILNGGDNTGQASQGLVTGFGGSVSIYPGQAYTDVLAGTLRVLDGRAGTRSIVLEVKPDYVFLNSGGDLSMTSALGKSESFVTIQSNGMTSIAAGTNLIGFSEDLVSVYGGNSIIAVSTGPISITAGTNMVGESTDLVSFFGANSVYLTTVQLVEEAADMISLYGASSIMLTTLKNIVAEAGDLASVFGPNSIYLTTTDLVGEAGNLVSMFGFELHRAHVGRQHLRRGRRHGQRLRRQLHHAHDDQHGRRGDGPRLRVRRELHRADVGRQHLRRGGPASTAATPSCSRRPTWWARGRTYGANSIALTSGVNIFAEAGDMLYGATPSCSRHQHVSVAINSFMVTSTSTVHEARDVSVYGANSLTTINMVGEGTDLVSVYGANSIALTSGVNIFAEAASTADAHAHDDQHAARGRTSSLCTARTPSR
jgi:hypothetical protein